MNSNNLLPSAGKMQPRNSRPCGMRPKALATPGTMQSFGMWHDICWGHKAFMYQKNGNGLFHLICELRTMGLVQKELSIWHWHYHRSISRLKVSRKVPYLRMVYVLANHGMNLKLYQEAQHNSYFTPLAKQCSYGVTVLLAPFQLVPGVHWHLHLVEEARYKMKKTVLRRPSSKGLDWSFRNMFVRTGHLRKAFVFSKHAR